MLEKKYAKSIRKKYYLLSGTLLIMLVIACIATTIGLEDASFFQVFLALDKWLSGNLQESADLGVNKIILLLRMPRILLAIFAGMGLAIAGTIMQSATRNPLMSSFTLGISAAAAFGASLCLVFATSIFWQSDLGVISCAFIAACSCGCLVYGIARKIGINPNSIVLVGIALNYFFSALTATIEFFAKEHKLESVVHWTFGSFNRATWDSVLITALVVMLCFMIIMRKSLQLNVLATSDDETAKSLGVEPEKLRTELGLMAVLMTATIISFTGIIGFVGLIAPHIARLIMGGDHRFYLPFAAILGAVLLVVADTIGKLIFYPVNIPVGIVISFLGVPLFIHLILTKSDF